ncbi:MAG: hypothetical protein AAGC46_13990 [Solirubrobacteraceae bacterium]|nr:hypothetical protein [Patulibacter sp.]
MFHYPPVVPAPSITTVPGVIYSAHGRSDGSFAVATGGKAATVTGLDPATGASMSPVTLLPADPVRLYADPRVDPAGGEVVFSLEGRPLERAAIVRDFDQAGHQVGATTTLALGPDEFPRAFGVGPTGAVAIVTDGSLGGAVRPRLSFRPSGQTAFTAPTELGPTVSRREALFDAIVTRYDVLLGPDGGGVLLVQPGFGYGSGNPHAKPYLRRILPSGQIGPHLSIPGLDRRDLFDATAEMNPDGTAVVVVTATRERPHSVPLELTSTLRYATLAPTAASVTAPRRLPIPHSRDGASVVDVSGLGPHTVVLTAKDEHSPITVSEGLGSALPTPVGTIPAAFRTGVHMVQGADGGVTVTGALHGQGYGAIIESHQPPGGAFSAPRTIVTDPNPKVDYEPGVPRLLADGEVVLPYTYVGAGGETSAIARFTP